MSNHQKRLAVPDSWPVERKEATYTTKAGAGPHGEGGVPLLIVLRDVLGYADSKKEARYALGQDSVLVNGTAVSDERRPIGMFDILTFREREEDYRVFPDEGGRLSLTPIDAGAAGSKLGKIEGKRQVPGGDTQLTLHDGRTLLVDDDGDYGTNDSIVVSNDESRQQSTSDGEPQADGVVAHFPYEEGALVTAVRGSHAGRIGSIEEIQVTPGSSANDVLIEEFHGEADFETIEEYVVVIDENFVEGADADAATEPEADDAEDDDEVSEADDAEDDDEVSEGDEGEAAEGDDDEVAEGDDDEVAEGDDDEVAEADGAEAAEGDDDEVAEADGAEAAEGDDDEVAEADGAEADDAGDDGGDDE